ncbi:MAG: DMT family transporter [Polyangiaceae bacterium]|nr:DMT family transporter [Polyangiaceae bacterium]
MKRPLWLVLVASVAFATASPLSRVARPAHPIAIAFGRLLIATVLLSIVNPVAIARAFARLDAKSRVRVVFAGLLLAAHFALFQWGLDETSLPAAVSLVSLEPLAVVLTAWALFGIAPKRLEKIGVAVATAGALVVARGAGEGEHRLLGDLLVLGAVGIYGLYVASARGLRDVIEPLHYAPLVYGFAALSLAVSLPFVPAHTSAVFWPLPGTSILAIAALAVIPTIVGHTLVQLGARTLSPSLVALVSPGETLGSIAIAMVVWQKPPTIEEALGGAVILIGSAIAMRAQAA